MKPKQSIPKHLRFTIEHFNAQFPDNDACLEFLKEQRYPSGLVPCAKCEQGSQALSRHWPPSLRLRPLRKADLADGWNDL